MDAPADIRARLSDRLRVAMRARDRVATAALRTTMGAIANAEAVPAPTIDAAALGDGPFAGSVRGLGATEVERRTLDEPAVAAVVEAEIADLLATAGELDGHGASERAAELRDAAAVLRAVLDQA